MIRRGGAVLAATLLTLIVAVAGSASGQDDNSPIKNLGFNRNPAINESSGLAIASTEDAFWTFNDSGGEAQLFLLQGSGKLLYTVQLRGARNVDWEAMTRFNIDDQPWLVVADVGDNQRRRKTCQLYFCPEPKFDPNDRQQNQDSVAVFPLSFQYQSKPDDAEEQATVAVSVDCEAVGVDIANQQLWLVEKVYWNADRQQVPRVFALPIPIDELKQWDDRGRPEVLKPGQPISNATPIGKFPIRNVTGMAFSPDGKSMVIRNYINAHLYRRPETKSWRQTLNGSKPEVLVLPLQRQGEAICFSSDSKSVIVTSEMVGQPIWQVKLPQ